MATVLAAEELGSLKYSDLQNLAKSLGLRANLRDESQAFASSADETEVQINSGEQATKEQVDHITKTRRRRRRHKTVPREPVSQQDHSEVSLSHFTELQSQDLENWDFGTTGKVPSVSDKSLGDEHTVSLGKDNEDSKEPSEKHSRYTDGFFILGNRKRTAVTTPNFKKLHEAHFKEMESIDEYIKRRKKHHSSHEMKKQSSSERGVTTPKPPGSVSIACTPASQQRSQGQAQGPARRRAMSLKGSAKHSVLSATKMNVRFSAATKDNEHKRSLTKTPARKSPHVTMAENMAKGQTVFGTPTLKTTKGKSAATPHKGKLKPWGQSKENNYLNEHVSRVSFHKKTYKQPPIQTREEQWKKHEQERKKKAKVLGARRGLIMVKDK
ncbi:nucleolar and spindle-associated protein 1-like isoform X3 [Octodon degus]|uniref:Nucleolar and spindle-associated protein 1-like isoform X3 n=1 Tax=Octodon degus TaxID=10160 RepID=A0A6P6DZT9_OCTDE|nr:nucleolar and spindle-associated protein 1-like isoform X3 [Octodon degus]